MRWMRKWGIPWGYWEKQLLVQGHWAGTVQMGEGWDQKNIRDLNANSEGTSGCPAVSAHYQEQGTLLLGQLRPFQICSLEFPL